jgi:hypothetical protein
MRQYLALSNLVDAKRCEFPDSGKVLIVTGNQIAAGPRLVFRTEATVDYYDRERNDQRS